MILQDYYDKVNEKLDSLSDEEFEEILIDAGIENCPDEIDDKIKYDYEKLFKFIINDRYVDLCDLCIRIAPRYCAVLKDNPKNNHDMIDKCQKLGFWEKVISEAIIKEGNENV